jgi:hypothetical protein
MPTKVTLGGEETDIQVPRGTDLVLEFTHQDDAGAAVDITGYTFTFEVKPTPRSASADFSLTTGGGEIAIITPTSGRYNVTMAAAKTDKLRVRTAGRRWEVWRTNSGSHRRLAFGKFQLEDEVVDL